MISLWIFFISNLNISIYAFTEYGVDRVKKYPMEREREEKK